jgi:hypothetical protein
MFTRTDMHIMQMGSRKKVAVAVAVAVAVLIFF